MNDLDRQRRLTNAALQGKEVFEIKPVIVGGSATEPANKTALSRADHIKAVTYWNRVIAGLRAKRAGGQ